MRGIREVDAGWTARGPGIWTDEEFSSSDDDLKDALVKTVQKVYLETAPRDSKRTRRAGHEATAASVEKTPFIVQKKRSAPQQTPAVVKKVRDIRSPTGKEDYGKAWSTLFLHTPTNDIQVYSRSILLEVRSRGSSSNLQAAVPENTAVNVLQCESSQQVKEQTKKSKKAEAKPELLFLRAIRDVRASA
ncbi:hypothetical protein AAVH_28834 [Aphelenchoides avenae]|nr:hypothetical protein AAVH_28834 [Aphelenchus avenae]